MTHQTSNMEGIDGFNIWDDLMQIEDELLNEEYLSLPDPELCLDHFPQPDPEDVFLPVCSRLGRDTVFNSLDGYSLEGGIMPLEGKPLADTTVQHPDPQPLMMDLLSPSAEDNHPTEIDDKIVHFLSTFDWDIIPEEAFRPLSPSSCPPEQLLDQEPEPQMITEPLSDRESQMDRETLPDPKPMADPEPQMITELLTDRELQMDRETLADPEPQVTSESNGASSSVIGYNNQTAVPFKQPLQIQQNNQEYAQPGNSQQCSQPVYSHSSQPVPAQQYGQPVQNQLVYSPYTVQNSEPVLIPQYSQPAYNQQYTQPGPSQPVYSHSSQPVPVQQYGEPVQNQLVYSQYQPVMTQQYGQPVQNQHVYSQYQPVMTQQYGQPVDSQTQQNQQYSQAGFTNQDQYVPPQQAPATVTTGQMPVVGPQPITLNPLVTQDIIRPIGEINGQMMYEIVTGQSVPNICTTPPTRESPPRKRQRDNNDEPGDVKRPLNSFMIFKDEHRPQVIDKLNIRDSKEGNIVQRWRTLSPKQQFKYSKMVQKVRRLHEDAHPDSTPSNSHGRGKRQRTSTTAFGNGSAAQAQFSQQPVLQLPTIQQ